MRRTLHSGLFLLASIVAVAICTFGQQSPDATNIFTGFVHSSAGIPIPGATVKLTNSESRKSWISWTDESGKFEFPGLPPGHYRAEASQLGFAAVPSDLTLPIASGTPVVLSLRVMTLAELDAAANPGSPRGSARANANRNSNTNQGNGGAGGAAGRQSAGGGRGFGQFPRGGFGGQNRQLPAGVSNALREGMASTGFEETDLTEEAGGQENENTGANGPAGLASSSDSFVMNGTISQGMNLGGPPGPSAQFPELPGMAGGPVFGNAVGGFGGIPGGNPAIQLAGGPGFGGFAGGPGPGGPGGPPMRFGQGGPGGLFGGGGGRGGRGGGGGGRGGGNAYFRRAVNRVRFGFFDQYQNSALDARPYSLTGVPAPVVGNYSERLGGDIGGPLKIPHIYDGSDRTFFFLNYTHQTSKNPIDTFATVPTLTERQGNFCSLGVQLFDPTSNISGPRTALPCQLPGTMMNSASLGLLQYIPLPNLPGTAQNYNLQTTTPTNSDAVNYHVIHTINAKFNVQVGYNFLSSRSQSLSSFPGIGSNQSTRSQSVNLGLTQNFSSKFLQSVQLTWSRNRVQTLSFNSYENNIAGGLGITGIASDPIDYGIPAIGFTSFTGLNDPVPSLTRNQTLRFSDNFTYSFTRHTIRFGGEVRRLQFNTDTNPTPRGSFTFTGLMTSQLTSSGTQVPGTGLDFADFLLGLPQSTLTRFGASSQYLRSWMFIGYGQDDWRVNTKFSIEYGIRYEVTTPPVSLINTLANLDVNSTFTAADLVTPGQTGLYQGAYPRSLIRGDYGTWAPRVGFAWRPFEKAKTVVRGGYSIFYNENVYNQLAAYLSNQPPWAQAQTRLTTPAQVLTLQDGFPGEAVGDLLNTAAVDPNYKVGYAQMWSLGTETQLPGYWVVDATYTGTKGTHLDMLFAPNRPAPGSPLSTVLPIANAGSFTYDFSGGNSIYNGLQLRLIHRFTRGVMFQAIYTYSKSIDDASSIGGGAPTIVENDDDIAAERGLSAFDMRHQLRFISLYQLPFGQRQRWFHHGLAEHLLGNLRVNTLLTFHTGIPYTAQVLSNSAGNSGTGTNFSTRADQIGNPSLGLCGGSTSGFFNTGVFVLPPAGSYGNAARGTIEGPCAFNLNFSVARSWRLGSTDRNRQITARWDINNLTNTPTFSGLSTIVGSSTFGRITGAGAMRTMDLNLRFNF